MKQHIIYLLCVITLCYALQKRDICQSDECDESCDGSDCNYCSGSTCCETSQCNSCVNTCRNSCSQRSCAKRCVNSCSSRSSCDSCTTRSCHRDCEKSSNSNSSTGNNANSATSTAVNVTTNIDLKNYINNTNYINNPIWVNSTNINNIKVELKSPGHFFNGTNKYTEDSKDCCVVVPPKQCAYNNTELECNQNPYKVCSNICKTPVVIPHPVPVYRPYPVPYPVHHVKHVFVPQREPVYIPVQQPCPLTSYGGSYYPTCRDASQSQNFMRTQQQFLIDPQVGNMQGHQLSPFCKFSKDYPYYSCNNVHLQQCGGCVSCNNEYNPKQCLTSSSCSNQCRQSLSHLNLEGNFGNMLNCMQTPDGRVVCN